jgi:hypothetical protein
MNCCNYNPSLGRFILAYILTDCVKCSEGCLMVELGALGGFISYHLDNPNAAFNLGGKKDLPFEDTAPVQGHVLKNSK